MASQAETTIKPSEAEHFGALAADWWNPGGSSAMLHKLNPARLSYIRNAINTHWAIDPHQLRPLAGKKVLDVGCGAGLLCEPLARLGGDVTGIDAAPQNVAAASAHAERQGLLIDYRAIGIESLGVPGGFDLVTSLEVIEHVSDPALFLRGIAGALAPGGLLILSTPNRTPLSRLTMITIGEGLNVIPKGTHDWRSFVTPEEMDRHLGDAGLEVIDKRGIAFDPRTGFVLSKRMDLNYILSARHRPT